MEVKKHLQLVWLYFKLNLSASVEYRGSFIIQVFGMMLNNLAFVFFWSVIFEKVSNVSGYEFKDVMFIWALASAAFGFAHIVFGNIHSVGSIIINGELDAYLLQPKDVYINVLCSRTSISAWGDLAYGLILFVIISGLSPVKWLMFIGFVIFGGLLMGSIMAAAQTMTFYMGNATSIGRLVTEFLLTFTLYPESIYKGAVRWVIYSLLPAGFITYMPLRVMKYFSWESLCVLILVDIAYIIACYGFFRMGLKRYESGNLIGTKL